MRVLENTVAISGSGISKVGRKTNRPAILHMHEAFTAALERAGLSRDDIDGIATYPGKSSIAPGMSPIGCTEVREAFGLKTRWHSSSYEGAAQMSALMIAIMAVATGQARHVLVFRALTESSSQTAQARASIPTGGKERISGWTEWLLPMGAYSPANWVAILARLFMHEHDLRKDQIGIQCVNQRANAQLNPAAVFNGKPLTLDDYMSSREISSPLSLFDCDIPVDGACAIIVSHMDDATGLKSTPLRVNAMSGALGQRDSWDQQEDLTKMACHDAAAELWQRTSLTPKDVDVAALYDGFSIFVPMWMSAFGFCSEKDVGEFIQSGETRLTGSIPVNTCGGQLSAGRLHGYGILHEACLQLWGDAEKRQVKDAKIAAIGMGGGPLAGALLLQNN